MCALYAVCMPGRPTRPQRDLTDYLRPSVAVDVAVLTVPRPGTIDASLQPHVLLIRRDTGFEHGEWSLPGTFVHAGETLAEAVQRCLREKAGMRGILPRQLHVFDKPDRDDRGWVLSVGHLVVIPHDAVALDPERARLLRIVDGRVDPPGRRRSLPFDHDQIVEFAMENLQSRYERAPDPDRLLKWPVTLRDLRLVHEAVLGRPLQKDTFRRIMLGQLRPTGRLAEGTRGKPAELFDVVDVKRRGSSAER